MDKAAIKTFAINSRRKLMKDVEYRMSLVGVTKKGIQDSISDAEGIQTFTVGGTPYNIYDEDIKKRANLVKEVETKGFDNVVEEVAYTWFNRIIAIRFMEVNDYLPTRTRVLSSETPGKIEPDMVTEAFNLDLDYTEKDRQEIFKLKDENKLDELFRFLFIKQCNKLNEILPGLFEKTEDYMELLLNISFINNDGVLRNLVDTIPENDFTNQVEVIGWLYQFYNTELKDETFANLNKMKITKERIPAATQLFTPDWIVKYMVENSLGRMWLEGHPNNELKSKWKYYIDDAEQEPKVDVKLSEIRENSRLIKPEDIKIIDPCMGSGHILVYIFDVLMQIYVSEGFTEKDAAISIIDNNLYGLDIDDRAYQLAYFAVLMKARSFNRRIFSNKKNPLIFSIKESNRINQNFLNIIHEKFDVIYDDIIYLIDLFKDAKEYGSLLNVKKINFDLIKHELNNFLVNNSNDLSIITFNAEFNLLKDIISQAELLYQKYDIVITNPPYMGSKNMNSSLKNFVDLNYKKYKADLFAVFIKKCEDLTRSEGIYSMITQQSFMFLNSFKSMRSSFLEKTIINMVQLGSKGFDEIGGEVVQAVSFVQRKIFIDNFLAHYVKLTDYNSSSLKEKEFFNEKNHFLNHQENFALIEGSPITYWASEKVYNHFKNTNKLKDFIDYTGSFHKTANNEKYLRFFWEIDNEKMYEWRHYNKGGKTRKWYGNNELVVLWTDSSCNYYKTHKTANLFKEEFWNREGITWTSLTSSMFNARYFEEGFVSDFKGASIYPNISLNYILGFMNSSVFYYFIKLLVPNMDFNIGQVVNVPFINNNEKYIDELVSENIIISKKNWDSKESSFNFIRHPLLDNNFDSNNLKVRFNELNDTFTNEFHILKLNEEKINSYFMDLFDFNELSSEVDNKNVTLLNLDSRTCIKEFILYSIGCMFGRYSLTKDGLICTNNNFDINEYSNFIPDDDNIIPVLDTEYFDDDIVGRFVEFVKTCFGEYELESNLDFIARSLGKRGKTSREIIRNYLLTDFNKDQTQFFQKCPIYWMFNSGKENGFNCLIYMHRYEPGIVARIRTDYLHKTQKAIELNIARCDNIINNSNVASDKIKATKEKNKLIKQLEETREYDEALAYIANQNIEIDLDDGVKVNYAKFQNVEVSKEGQKTKKINLLKKI